MKPYEYDYEFNFDIESLEAVNFYSDSAQISLIVTAQKVRMERTKNTICYVHQKKSPQFHWSSGPCTCLPRVPMSRNACVVLAKMIDSYYTAKMTARHGLNFLVGIRYNGTVSELPLNHVSWVSCMSTESVARSMSVSLTKLGKNGMMAQKNDGKNKRKGGKKDRKRKKKEMKAAWKFETLREGAGWEESREEVRERGDTHTHWGLGWDIKQNKDRKENEKKY